MTLPCASDNLTLFNRVYTTDQQMQSINAVTERLVEDEDRYRVLIIDSVMSIFRSEFQGRGELAERQQTLGRHLAHLTKDEYLGTHSQEVTNTI